MKKKILSMLLVACMIVGLLPMVALAADPVPTETKINFNATGGANGVIDATARYYKTTTDGNREAGTEDDWNMKTQMVDGVAVVTLKGAKLGNYEQATGAFSSANNMLSGHTEYTAAPVKFVIEADSYFNTSASAIRAFGSMTSITIECKNDATLYFNSTGAGTTIDASGVPVYLINAKIEATRTKTEYVNGAYILCSTLSITNSTVNFKGSVFSGGKPGISTTGDMTVDNSTLLCENVRYGDGIVVGGNLLVKKSTVNCPGSTSYSHMMSVAGDCTIEGNSAVTVNGGTNSVVVGGNLKVTDSSLSGSSVWAGVVNVAKAFTAENSTVTLYCDKGEAGGSGFAGTLEGGITIKDSTILLTANQTNRNSAAFMPAAPTLTYTNGYYVVLGEAMDGSDAAAVTDLETLTEKGKAYLKIAAKEANSWTTEPSIEGWTYGETAKTPVGAAAKGDVVFTYSDAEDGTYTATVPTNAGTYYMKAEVAAGDTYAGLSKVVSFTIAKAAAPVAPTGLTAVVGKTLADIALPEGWTWVDATLSVGAAGTNTFKANYTGTNSESATNVDVTITVAAANTPDPSNPQTGDNTAVLTAITLFALTAMAAAVVVTKKVIVR